MYLKTGFSYNGVHSSEFDLLAVRTDNGMIEFPFGVSRDIIEEKINKRNPYFFGIEEQPLEFTIELSKEGGIDYNLRTKIVKWLFTDTYKPLVFDDNDFIIYYAIAIGEPTRMDNGIEEGYITINFRCNAPYGYSQPVTITELVEGTKIIIINNLSNVLDEYYPEVEFTLKGNNKNLTIRNLSDNGREFVFNNLNEGETVYVDNAKKRIVSNLPNIYRYDNFNKHWLKLMYGKNLLEITGDCEIKFRLQYPIAN